MTGKSKSRTRVRPPSQESGRTPKANPGAIATGKGQRGGQVAPEAGCSDLAEPVVLMSPDPEVLKRLNPGDVLKVERRGKPVVAVFGSDVAGAIVVAELTRLISCIDRGFKFVFTVSAVNGGRCDGVIHCVGKP